MKNTTFCLFINLLCLFPLSAQLLDCDCNNLYQDEIFNDINIEQNFTYSDVHNLKMDI